MILNQLCPLKRIQYEERRKRVKTRKQDKSKFQLFASWRLYVSQHLKEKVGILDQKSIKPLIFWHLHFAPHWMWNKEREFKQENRTSQNPSYLPLTPIGFSTLDDNQKERVGILDQESNLWYFDTHTLPYTWCETKKEGTNKETGQVKLPRMLTVLRSSTLVQKLERKNKDKVPGWWVKPLGVYRVRGRGDWHDVLAKVRLEDRWPGNFGDRRPLNLNLSLKRQVFLVSWTLSFEETTISR